MIKCRKNMVKFELLGDTKTRNLLLVNIKLSMAVASLSTYLTRQRLMFVRNWLRKWQHHIKWFIVWIIYLFKKASYFWSFRHKTSGVCCQLYFALWRCWLDDCKIQMRGSGTETGCLRYRGEANSITGAGNVWPN